MLLANATLVPCNDGLKLQENQIIKPLIFFLLGYFIVAAIEKKQGHPCRSVFSQGI